MEVPALRDELAQRRPAHDRAGHGREAAARGLPRPVREEHPRPGDTGARMRLEELAERGDRARLRNRVGIRRDQGVAGREREPGVEVRREAARRVIVDRVDTGRDRPGDVRDHDQLVDLLAQRGEGLLELVRMAVRDDDGGDLHAAPRTRR